MRSNIKFAKLFKKYRLRSEIETLSDFGDLLAQDGFVYENSLFTKWQSGSRLPSERHVIIAIVHIFIKHGGIQLVSEANCFLEAAGHGFLTNYDKSKLPSLIDNIQRGFQTNNIGPLLKSYRIQKNISLEEISVALNQYDVTDLEHIEEGNKDIDNRDFIEKYCSIIGLQQQEINNIYLIGNYLPTKLEIERTQSKVATLLESYQYSTVLYDFCWRVIYINKKHSKILNMNDKIRSEIHRSNPTAIEILFDPNFISNKILHGNDMKIWHHNLIRFITHFRSMHLSIIRDEKYKALISKMQENKLFRKLWAESENQKQNFITTRKGYKIFIHNNMRLAYHIYVVPLYEDPRFEIEYYSPADSKTLKFYHDQKRG